MGQVELKLPERRQQDRAGKDEAQSSGGGEWKAAYDQSRGQAYYYHTITKEVRWEANPGNIAESNNKKESTQRSFASPKTQTKPMDAPSPVSSGLKQRRTPRQKQQHGSRNIFSPRNNVSGQVETVLAQVLHHDNEGRATLLSKYTGREDEMLQALEELRSEGKGKDNTCSVVDVTDKMMRIKSRRSTGAVNNNNNNVRNSGGPLMFSPYRQTNGKAGTPTPRKRTSPTVVKSKLNSPSIGIARTFTADSEDSLERGSPNKANTTNSPRRSRGSSSRKRERIIVWSVLALVVVLVCAIAVTMRSRSSSDGDGNGRTFHVNSVTAADNYGFVATTSDPTAAPTATPTSPAPSPSPTIAPTQSPTQSPTGPTQSPTPRPTYLDNYEHVVSRVDSQACPPRADSLPMLMAVTNREVTLGCHSFEQYLSPRYETVFILNEDFVNMWEIDKLVQSATCDQTLGAHILMLDNTGGELLGRRLAVDFLEREEMRNHRKLEFLNQMNCDVHPLPEAHVMHMDLDRMMEKMIRDFYLARAQREPHRYPEIPQAPMPLADNLPESKKNREINKYEILAMGPLLFEDFPTMTELPLETHGHDVCEWGSNGGIYSRPWNYGSWPWLCDVHSFTENHSLLFDVDKLLRPGVRRHFLEIPREHGLDGFASDTRTTPRIALQHELTILVNRDVYAHQNFAHGPNALDGYQAGDLDMVKIHNFLTVSKNRSPKPVYDVWNGLNNFVIPEPYIGGTAIDFVRGHSDGGVWMPQNVYNMPLQNCAKCRMMVDSFFGLLGYEVLREDGNNLHYCLKGVYPSNIYIFSTKDPRYRTPNDSWEFMRLSDGSRFIALGKVKTNDMREMRPDERTVIVQKNARITRLFEPSEMNDRDYITSRGRYKRDKARREICGAPDQDRKTACGYLESENFVYPY